MIFFRGHQLSELFIEEEIADFMVAARQRVIGEFFYATEENPRYRPGSGMKSRRGTDNFICKLSGKPSDLARYVVTKMHRGFIAKHQLPSELTELSPKLIEMIIQRAQYDIIIAVINPMRQQGEIRYDEGVGIWEIRQSAVDEFLAFRQAARRLKDDYRPWHGRPGRDRGTMPEGVSVSFA